jgi:HPt (histidine-containing phosphotransfer) domain-containing protein
MIDDIRARFLPRFAQAAKGRIERARALVASAEWSGIASELHALAGEAALLEVRDVAGLARQVESLARAAKEPEEIARLLEEIARSVEALPIA